MWRPLDNSKQPCRPERDQDKGQQMLHSQRATDVATALEILPLSMRFEVATWYLLTVRAIMLRIDAVEVEKVWNMKHPFYISDRQTRLIFADHRSIVAKWKECVYKNEALCLSVNSNGIKVEQVHIPLKKPRVEVSSLGCAIVGRQRKARAWPLPGL